MADHREQDRRRGNAARNWAIGAGIGSAAILGGLLYAGRLRKAAAERKPSRLPEDLPPDDEASATGNVPHAPDVRPG